MQDSATEIRVKGDGSDAKFDDGGSAAAFVLRRLGDGNDVGVVLQEAAKGFAEDAHAAAVYDADAGKAGEEGAVEKLLNFAGGLIDIAADDVDFGGDAGVFALERDGDAVGAGGLDG
jgi:hypothetical protein